MTLELRPLATLRITIERRTTMAGLPFGGRLVGEAAALPVTGAPVYTTPTFETDDPDLAWLNGIQAVGKGVRDGSSLIYELYELA